MIKPVAEPKVRYRNNVSQPDTLRGPTAACHHRRVGFGVSFLIGIFLGFVFGVGCALAVMYSIFLGGYRAALRDCELPEPPKRLLRGRAKLMSSKVS